MSTRTQQKLLNISILLLDEGSRPNHPSRHVFACELAHSALVGNIAEDMARMKFLPTESTDCNFEFWKLTPPIPTSSFNGLRGQDILSDLVAELATYSTRMLLPINSADNVSTQFGAECSRYDDFSHVYGLVIRRRKAKGMEYLNYCNFFSS
ncbi:hypothetical protein CVT26_003135 [Gymnopilus dilepis]|uniref:Uncharacterized protein n=1 Tax=Gymnopilus dilepis TaxID=231916 RepID=A0A409Y4R7_9AGAR|nr:hypothetical protein CVT26_003135 [Gymnopilus dilepis]